LYHRETVDINTVRSTTVRANLDGFANEIAENPELIDRYFQTVYLEEGFKKIHVFATANANWEQVDGRPGDPINRLSVQVGYPDSKGNINWKSAARYKQEDGTLTSQPDMASWTLDNKDRVYVFDFTKHENLGKDQDKIYIRKDISFNEDPRVPVNTITEEYEVDGDETIEVRAETAGKVSVGPIDVDTPIETDQVKAIVTFKVPNLEPQVFELNTESMKKAQYFEVWYEKPEDVQAWQYKVEAIVKGKRFGQKSVRWASNWEQGGGNGPITVSIPAPTDKQNRLIEEYLTETAPAEAVS